MEPLDLDSLNLTLAGAAPAYPRCERWSGGSEGSVFHLGNALLLLGFMGCVGGGGGLPAPPQALLALLALLAPGFLLLAVAAWPDPCTADPFLWNSALFGLCAGRAVHVAYRLRSLSFDQELQELYNHMFRKAGVSLVHFGEIVLAGEPEVGELQKEQRFAAEGKTPIDKLSVLLSGRVAVSVHGEFLHFIYPFQFLDSPEWDSLRPSEDGLFQVTLRAEETCRYVTWRRKKLYLLFAKHRYIARIFALIVRSDIAEKLYSLNDQACNGSGHRYDLRLPSYCHMPGTELEKATDLQVPALVERAA
ncbi:popeye domain-containing protein 3 [Cololabis saira]|uniref:popeye domain-containing protein 3 n=1 Tax=Cololabis saira TaxID=129043 RepID=UPI002AD23F9D|nr:popeye domain-containing protein 3 [Cololabis saira]